MKVGPGPAMWARRAVLVIVLVGAAVVPSRAISQHTPGCHGATCRGAGSVLWTRRLPGSWIAEGGLAGTVSSQGAAYAAVNTDVAVVGFGSTVAAFDTRTGHALWQTTVVGVPVGSQIVGVRALGGEVAVGVQPPPGGHARGRDEVILSATTGLQIRIYPSAPYGGAIAADAASTVIVGPHAVTAYANSTGRILWSQPTGQAQEAWRVDGQYVYVAQTSGGDLGSFPVHAVYRINLSTGAEGTLHAGGQGFAGRLSGAVDGVMLFSGSDGVWAYSAANGKVLWHRSPAVLELTDAASGTAYLAANNTLTGISALTGTVVSTAPKAVSGSLYWVRDGIALGLDQGALGDAWGYRVALHKVVWTSPPLPWPHFFVDLSGLGGSANPASSIVVVATCAQLGPVAATATSPSCRQPELVAVQTKWATGP